MPTFLRARYVLGFLGALALLVAGCDTGFQQDDSNRPELNCQIPESQIIDGGVGRDGIPALTDPSLTDPSSAGYLADSSRVIGLVVDGEPVAVPHNILWWHEIINFNFDSIQLAVTYCPLTGSSLAFDRAAIDGGEFGVSGLLFQNNLTMFDRTNQESLWPQMNQQADCGPRLGAQLTMVPVVEMRWDGWRALHPDTRVVSNNTGFNRDYTPSGYPYGNYERIDNDRLLFDMPIDERRPPKERVLGIPASGSASIAFPFGALDAEGPKRVVEETVDGDPVVVFWSRARRGAMAFRPVVNGQPAIFEVRDGRIVDTATESTWTVGGEAIDGPLSGTRLTPIREAYVAFWFAWAAFEEDTRLWEGS